MKIATNRTIYDLIDSLAPFGSQEDFDNAGFLIGDKDRPVTRILVALDVCREVVQEARRLRAQLLVTHHPLMFHPLQSLCFDHPEGALIRDLISADLSLISAHTNLDQSSLSAGRILAASLGLQNIRKSGEDKYLILGDLPVPKQARDLGLVISHLLGHEVRCFGALDSQVRSLAIAGGAYDEAYLAARESGAEALLTGEVRYHNALAASQMGFVMYDGGHFQTEVCMVPALARSLQNTLDALEYNVEVYPSAAHHGAEGCILKEEA
ncbi:MAG: Nif3-like dinuclear metal center hexameric protein [Christensenellales bacterium]